MSGIIITFIIIQLFAKPLVPFESISGLQIYVGLNYKFLAKPHGSVGRVVDLRTEGRWFDPRSANILSEDC